MVSGRATRAPRPDRHSHHRGQRAPSTRRQGGSGSAHGPRKARARRPGAPRRHGGSRSAHACAQISRSGVAQRLPPPMHKPYVSRPIEGLTDAEIILRARRDPDAFGILYARHAHAVHRFLVRRVDPSVAEDLLADVFTTAFSARLRVFPHASSSVLPWLYGIAGNVIRSHRRRGASAAATVAALSGSDETQAALDWDAVDARVDA